MALNFLKKFAAKLLGGIAPEEKKAQPRKPGQTAGSRPGQNGPARERPARGGNGPASQQQPRGPRGQEGHADAHGSWAARTARSLPEQIGRSNGGRRFDRRDRNGNPSQSQRPPRRGPEAQPQQQAPGASAPAQQAPEAQQPQGQNARPPRGDFRRGRGDSHRDRPPRDRRDRSFGRGPGRVENTAAGQMRPGGAVSDEVMAARKAEHAKWSVDQFQVPPAEGKKRFQDFDLPSEILHGIADKGFQYCTPIQALSLEHALAGKNVAGRAQTGTGKTAAYLVAILTRYLRTPESRAARGGLPRALVLAPTRELVIQICKDAEDLGKYCGLRSLAVYGGMDYERQKHEVADEPVDLLVATPGRLLDFMRSRVIDLSKADTVVIDEADRMLDMGFIPDVRAIMSHLPPKDKRSTMLYSATLSDDVMKLAEQWMDAPVKAEVEGEVSAETIKQIVYVVTAHEKFTVLYNHIMKFPDSRMLIFCNRKTTTDDVAYSLNKRGLQCEVLSGDVNQNRRLRVLEDFRAGKVRLVVATDVAGRGLQVDDIGFVVNFDFPYEPEDYVHRIGRTGRAGHSGVAISFADENESFIIPDIEKFIGEPLHCTVLHSDDPLLTKIPQPGRNAPRPAPAAVKPAAPAAPAAAPAEQEEHDRKDETPAPAAPVAVAPAPAPAPAAPVAVVPAPAPAPAAPVAVAPAPAPAPAPVVKKAPAPAVVAKKAPAPAPRRAPLPPPPPAPTVKMPYVSPVITLPGGIRKQRFSDAWVPGGKPEDAQKGESK